MRMMVNKNESTPNNFEYDSRIGSELGFMLFMVVHHLFYEETKENEKEKKTH